MGEQKAENGNTVFDEPINQDANQASETQPQENSTFSIPEEAKEFIGEGKKYKSIEDAIKSIPHAQRYIEEQKQTIEEMKQKLEELELLKKSILEQKEQENVSNQSSGFVDTKQNSGADLSTLVQQEIQKLKQQEVIQTNLQNVDNALKKKFGEKTSEVFQKTIIELGITKEMAIQMAGTSPKAFLKLFDTKGESIPNKPVSSINSEAIINNSAETKPKSVMSGATTKEMVAAWRAVKERIGG